ncbi:hypothetical protein HELRODRAFT_171828 [Helobdella robusta]|uniref:Uncharacterized protein n=1 Tax=Helobdella robusta TaxID=6412 RepID=T1F4R1_HELRO|nr:hypothetical protein HELRODRAFT_171828 [Helobdella robusta]ESO05426.1 hypothetical protein HELRODRAFT_171828 [Helobdella robusta]
MSKHETPKYDNTSPCMHISIDLILVPIVLKISNLVRNNLATNRPMQLTISGTCRRTIQQPASRAIQQDTTANHKSRLRLFRESLFSVSTPIMPETKGSVIWKIWSCVSSVWTGKQKHLSASYMLAMSGSTPCTCVGTLKVNFKNGLPKKSY